MEGGEQPGKGGEGMEWGEQPGSGDKVSSLRAEVRGGEQLGQVLSSSSFQGALSLLLLRHSKPIAFPGWNPGMRRFLQTPLAHHLLLNRAER